MVEMVEERVQQALRRKAISPVKRAQLEETFKRANEKIATPQGFEFAIELLGICVVGDPANPVYVRAYLESLQKHLGKKGAAPIRLKDRGAPSALKKAITQSHWDEAIRHGLEALKASPWDVATLSQMATAAKQSGDSDSALCYLKVALTKSPKDPTCNRMAALVLDEMGLVNQAIVFWQRVLEALPKDKEAKEAISAFQVGPKNQGAAQRRGPTAEEQEELVRQREEAREAELARQRKMQEEAELARQQELEQQAESEQEEHAIASSGKRL